jgi:hypothetical protein
LVDTTGRLQTGKWEAILANGDSGKYVHKEMYQFDSSGASTKTSTTGKIWFDPSDRTLKIYTDQSGGPADTASAAYYAHAGRFGAGTVRSNASGVFSVTASDTVGLAAAIGAKADSTRMNTLRGTDTTRAIVREGLKLDKSSFADSLSAHAKADSVSICVASLDSSMLDSYGQDATKLYGGYYLSRTFTVDSLIVVVNGAIGDTVQVDYRFGPSYVSASGGTAIWTVPSDAFNYTVGTRVGSPNNATIPKGDFIWFRITRYTGVARLVTPLLKGRFL